MKSQGHSSLWKMDSCLDEGIKTNPFSKQIRKKIEFDLEHLTEFSLTD